MKRYDVFDLIIETLQHHEKILEELSQRIENCLTDKTSIECLYKKVHD